MKHSKILVKGKVQGVYYRASTVERAKSLGLVGTVRNLDDGSVMIEAEGEQLKLDALIKWCKIGPAMAKVQRVDVLEGEVKNYDTFTIVRR